MIKHNRPKTSRAFSTAVAVFEHREVNGTLNALGDYNYPTRRHLRILVTQMRHFYWPRWQRAAFEVTKRAIDIIASSTALVLLFPLFAVVALAIKLTDWGPVFFWQWRVGKDGALFEFPKFRSMVRNAEAIKDSLRAFNQHGDGVTFKIKHDPRITQVGRLIRRFSIDELPQLWNVLKGDMSLVGPRPALPKEVARYSLRDRIRLSVIPGLTCIWQVSGRSDIPFERQVQLDADYIHQQSIWLDAKLLLQTVPAVVTGKGAY